MPTQLPRVNVTVTQEQHALLLEMAQLDGGRSAAGFLRELLDQVTPLLRVTVPAMRAAAQEHSNAKGELGAMVSQIQAMIGQPDLLDAPPAARAQRTAATSGARTQRTARRGRRQS